MDVVICFIFVEWTKGGFIDRFHFDPTNLVEEIRQWKRWLDCILFQKDGEKTLFWPVHLYIHVHGLCLDSSSWLNLLFGFLPCSHKVWWSSWTAEVKRHWHCSSKSDYWQWTLEIVQLGYQDHLPAFGFKGVQRVVFCHNILSCIWLHQCLYFIVLTYLDIEKYLRYLDWISDWARCQHVYSKLEQKDQM